MSFIRYNPRRPFLSQIGILAVRGCEIEGQVDKSGKLIPDEERFGLVPRKGEFWWLYKCLVVHIEISDGKIVGILFKYVNVFVLNSTGILALVLTSGSYIT